jgi:hypothetical protein
MKEPVGSLCVLPDDSRINWLVSICQGNGYKHVLRRFETRDKAVEWAIDERARRADQAGMSLTIHLPDDCPCTGEDLSW